jgi:hypothetical protein
MKIQDHEQNKTMQSLRTVALSYPEAQQGIACAGTAAEKRTIKARDKAFLFLGKAEVMLKLCESLAEAVEWATKAPSICRVGATGWVTLTVGNVDVLPLDLLYRWIDESYRLLAPKKLVALLGSRRRRSRVERRAERKKPRQTRTAGEANATSAICSRGRKTSVTRIVQRQIHLSLAARD